ncbi:MAG: electron transfer flavoprotein subunit beta/FixA family protein [Dehalococcoidales bacterium]
MNIIVCLKQVPDTADVKINPETNTLVREGIKNITNPFDTYALEEGVRLRERFGGKVTVISMGPSQAEMILREALACGADEAVLLSDRAFAGADTLATSYTLAKAVKKLAPYDLVICGRQTIDGDTGQVGPEIAEVLAVPFVAYVSEVKEIDEEGMRVKRMVENGYEIIESSLPAVISVVKEINTPRLPSLRGQMRARSAAVPVWTVHDLGIPEEAVGLAGSATRVIKIFYPQRVSRAEILSGDPEKQVTSLLEKLQESGIIQG